MCQACCGQFSCICSSVKFSAKSLEKHLVFISIHSPCNFGLIVNTNHFFFCAFSQLCCVVYTHVAINFKEKIHISLTFSSLTPAQYWLTHYFILVPIVLFDLHLDMAKNKIIRSCIRYYLITISQVSLEIYGFIYGRITRINLNWWCHLEIHYKTH